MKDFLIYFIFSISTLFCVSQEISLSSVFQMETSNFYVINSSAIYKDSIVYTIGSFSGSLAAGETQITSNCSKGIYLLKTSINSEFGWLKKIADNDFQVAFEPVLNLNIDSFENIIVGVGFRDKLYYSGDSTIIIDSDNGNKGIVLLKLDSEANLIWDKYIMATWLGNKGVVDNSNNILITGRRNNDFFLTKFNAQGDSLWTKTGGGSNSNVPLSGETITFDEQNNYYCSGALTTSNIIYFDSEHPIFNPLDFGKYGSFLAKYDSDGNIQWLKCLFASSEQIQFAPITSVDVKNGNVLIGGECNSNYLKSSPDEGSIGSSNPFGLNRGYLIMYDSDGNRIWSKVTHTQANGENGVNFIQFVDEGGFYATSDFTTSLVVQGNTVSGGSYGNLLIEKYSIDGDVENYFLVDGINRERLDGFFKIGDDFFLVGSTNNGIIYFNGTAYTLTSNPSFFIAKLHDNFVSINENESNDFSLYPNPTTDNIQLVSEKSLQGEEVIIYNSLGSLIQKQLFNNQFTNEIILPEQPGIYFLRINEETVKIVKQ